MVPRAWPDGNDVDVATTMAVAGRGRFAAAFANSVSTADNSTLTKRKSATRR
jgi:hypothetical protein